MKKNYCLTLAGILIIITVLVSFSFAQNEAKKGTKPESQPSTAVEEMKALSGEVVSLIPRSAPKMIGITYEADNADYHFIIAEDVKVVYKKGLNEIQVGDMVEITFKQTTYKDKEGKDMVERQAKVIKFIRPAKKENELISE